MRVVHQVCRDPECACTAAEMTSSLGRSVVLHVCVFALTHGGFPRYRNQRSARKHRDVVLPHCRTGRPTLSVATRFPDSSRREHYWSPQAFKPSSDAIFVIPQTWLAQPPTSRAAVTWMCRRACACCTTLGEKSVCHDWSSLRRNTAVRLNFNVTRHLCTTP